MLETTLKIKCHQMLETGKSLRIKLRPQQIDYWSMHILIKKSHTEGDFGSCCFLVCAMETFTDIGIPEDIIYLYRKFHYK